MVKTPDPRSTWREDLQARLRGQYNRQTIARLIDMVADDELRDAIREKVSAICIGADAVADVHALPEVE